MNMSEFEQQENNERRIDAILLPSLESNLPEDFTEEDLSFAAELGSLFSPEEEDLPPYYVQTLLEVEKEQFEPVGHGFERKTNVEVFRRLKLRRRLFSAHTSPLSVLSANLGETSLSRPVLALVAVFLLVMALTVAFTGPSFASGVAILLHGTHGSGTYGVQKYPQGMVRPVSGEQPSVPAIKEISLLAARSQMHFTPYLPEYIPSAYSLAHINLYVGLDQQWSDGPMLEFEYSLPPSTFAPKGTGEIWVREFKPREDVLQLVEEGASVPIDMDGSGRAMAIYVDGQWNPRGKNVPEWVYGERSELIYQQDGVIFWIVGDQRDGIGEKQLMNIAQGLVKCPFNQHFRVAGESIPVIQMAEDIPGPFSSDVIVVASEDGTSGPYYISVSAYQPSKNGSHTR